MHRRGRPLARALAEEAAGAERLGLRPALQLFAVGPQSTAALLAPAEAAAVGRLARRRGWRLLVHGSYLDAPWGRRPALARLLVRRELALAGALGALGVVVHLAPLPPAELARGVAYLLGEGGGRSDGAAAAAAARADGLSGIARPGAAAAPPYLLLETEARAAPPGAGTARPGATARLLRALERALPAAAAARVGLCVDTAHLWAAGRDLRSPAAAAALCAEMDGWRLGGAGLAAAGRLALHLNDQAGGLGASRDFHMPIGAGAMWGRGGGAPGGPRDGWRVLARWARARGVPVVLERNREAAAADLRRLARAAA